MLLKPLAIHRKAFFKDLLEESFCSIRIWEDHKKQINKQKKTINTLQVPPSATSLEVPSLQFHTHLHPLRLRLRALQWRRCLLFWSHSEYEGCSSGIKWTLEAEHRGKPGPRAHGAPLGAATGDKQLKDLHIGMTAGEEGANGKGVPSCIMWPYVCVCVCTYIIHVHQSIGQRERNTTHTLGRRKGCQGTKEALLILGGAGVVNRGPPSSLAECVGGTQREKPPTETQHPGTKQRDTRWLPVLRRRCCE